MVQWLPCCSLQRHFDAVTTDMRDELLAAQSSGAGLPIDWALVSLAGLLQAGGICQTKLELELRQQELACNDALGSLALRDSIQQSVLKPEHVRFRQAAHTSDR